MGTREEQAPLHAAMGHVAEPGADPAPAAQVLQARPPVPEAPPAQAAGQGAATSVPGGNAAAVSAVGAETGTAGVLAELSEAAAVKAEVELIAAGSDGSLRRIRMLPEGVRAGRVLGRTSAGTAVRIAASRVVEVRRV